MICNICCEDYGSSNTHLKNGEVKCNYCDFSACKGCIQKYIMTCFSDPHCMSCKKIWTKEFIDNSLQKTFLNTTYKDHRQNILLDREKSLMPSTQEFASNTLKSEKSLEIIHKLQEDILKEKNKYYELLNLINRQHKTNEKTTIIHRQCIDENCKGFIGEGWVCGICEIKICMKCHKEKIKGDEHNCIKEDLETAKILMSGTKACPGCATLIFKIDGCNQIWCTSCHTAFDWKTGIVESGKKIHNPHYYEYLRQTEGNVPRDPDDTPVINNENWQCIQVNVNKLRTISTNHTGIEISNYLKKHKLMGGYTGAGNIYNSFLVSLLRLHYHLDDVEIPRLNFIDTNHDLRVKYILNRITEDGFKRTIQKREKKMNKSKELSLICRSFSDVIMESLQRLCFSKDVHESVLLVKEFCKYKDYVNMEFKKVSIRYNNRTPYICKKLLYYQTGQDKNGSK